MKKYLNDYDLKDLVIGETYTVSFNKEYLTCNCVESSAYCNICLKTLTKK